MQRLKTWAEPLVDTVDSALVKALDAAEEARVSPSRARPGTEVAKPRIARGPGKSRARLPQKKFRQPLLKVIYQMGGSARIQDLRPVMKERMELALLPGDLEHVSTGDERWWNAICWERSALVKEGYIRGDSPRGIWKLSDKGVEHVKSSLPTMLSEPFVEHLIAIPDVGDDADFERDPSGPRRIEM